MKIKLIRKNLIEIDSVKFGVNFQWSSPILEKSKLKRRLKEEEFIRSSESNIGTYLKMEGDRFQLGMADKEYDGTNSLAAYFSGDKNTVYVIKIDEERFWHASYDSNGFIYIFSDKILSIHELSDSIREFISLSNESSKIKIVSLGGYFIFEDSNLEVIHERRGNEYTFYDPLRIKNSITEVKSVNLKRSIATSIGGALFVIVGGGYLYLSSGNGEYNKIVNGDYSSPANIEYNKVTKEIKKVNSVSGGFDENSFVKESVVDFHKYKLFTPQNAGSMIDIMMELRGKTPHIINGWDLISLTYEGANVYLNFSRAKGAPNSSNYKELDLVLIDKLSAYGYKVTPIRIQDKGDKRSYIVDLFKPSEKYYKYLSEVERIDNLKKELKDKINKYIPF